MNKRTRQTFSPEFKREAVRRLQHEDIEGAQLARELGIARNKLYLWKAELETHGDAAFPGQGGRTRKPDGTAALKAEIKVSVWRSTSKNTISIPASSVFFTQGKYHVQTHSEAEILV